MDQDVGLSVVMCNSEHPSSIYMGVEADDWELSDIKTTAQEDNFFPKNMNILEKAIVLKANFRTVRTRSLEHYILRTLDFYKAGTF